MSDTETSAPVRVSSAKLLIGEGVEERLFFAALVKHLGISGIQIEDYDGKDRLSSYLKTLKVRPGFAGLKVLGITRDADEAADAALASVSGAVQRAGFPNGLTVIPFILPGSGRQGALEDLCLQSFAGQPIERCITDYFACVERVTSWSRPSGSGAAKARVHAWLAAQAQPDLRLGYAAAKGYLDWTSPAFEELKTFLREGFG